MYFWRNVYISIVLLFSKFDAGYSVIRGEYEKNMDHAFMLNILCANIIVYIFTARCYVERGHATVPSVRLSVTLRYDFHTGWNTSKITSRPNSLRLTPT